jgi:hypothetical protein
MKFKCIPCYTISVRPLGIHRKIAQAQQIRSNFLQNQESTWIVNQKFFEIITWNWWLLQKSGKPAQGSSSPRAASVSISVHYDYQGGQSNFECSYPVPSKKWRSSPIKINTKQKKNTSSACISWSLNWNEPQTALGTPQFGILTNPYPYLFGDPRSDMGSPFWVPFQFGGEFGRSPNWNEPRTASG